MRTTRRLSEGERWELGLFMAMLLVGCLLITVLVRNNSLNHIFAFAWTNNPKTEPTPAVVQPNHTNPQLTQVSFNQLPVAPETLGQTLPAPPVEAVPPTVALPAKKSFQRKSPDTQYYDGQKYKYLRTIHLRVTAYAPDKRCTWPYPGTTTASGLSVKTNKGRLVAADTNLIPMYALVEVPGYSKGGPVPVLDRGGAIKGHRLDVLMPTFDAAKDWGSRMLDVKIYVPSDE